MPQKFDLDNWERQAQYHFFKTYEDPFINITANVDITALYRLCKEKEYSFFLASLYAATTVCNAIQEFRIRELEGELVIYEQIHPGSTVLNANNTFSYCYFDYVADLEEFIHINTKILQAHKANPNFDPKEERVDLIYFSTVPWISFTSIKHARSKNIEATIPKIVLGKFFPQGDRLLMPVSVEVNHAIMDGYHIGCFFEKINQIIH